MVCTWHRTLYLTERAKRGSKDSNVEILIRKTTIVRVHRESSTKIQPRREKNWKTETVSETIST